MTTGPSPTDGRMRCMNGGGRKQLIAEDENRLQVPVTNSTGHEQAAWRFGCIAAGARFAGSVVTGEENQMEGLLVDKRGVYGGWSLQLPSVHACLRGC
ncbi:hypothetical protein SKAU_G00286550 [Synaphobranchus kaupii]|uniref:Uncharacterized protein n=1 Tax=Synaphobranchus kaupii TaxID=118154 RepID=A0A9Q1EY35_SYNKA|nr:hypothetical protein SKAU_G00286550 [Synaphobranchus kaupii]